MPSGQKSYSMKFTISEDAHPDTHAQQLYGRNLRDPEDRIIDQLCSQERKEKMMDKTIADSFSCKRFPPSLPDPNDDSFGSPCS